MRQGIADGTYPVGSQLPSRRQVISVYRCSMMTLAHAQDVLEREGLIRVSQGRRPDVIAVPGSPNNGRWDNSDLLAALAALSVRCDELLAVAGPGRRLHPKTFADLPAAVLEVQLIADRLEQQHHHDEQGT